MGVPIKASIRQVSATASEASARGHKSLVDRPEAKGGSNQGPMGGELMLMGIGGCFMSNLLAAAQARSLAVADLVVEVTAMLEIDPPRFSEIALAVSGNYDDADTMREIVTVAENGCIAVNTVRGALKLTVTLA
ncbi:MAG: OsmC family protein [Gammaproteobacteria bacterium]|nr:OsmC family protein [Gammaproteobacteria bacterium]MBU1645608.1 OsmC family protein [Gammaproteobacteria bacterium]MBU1973590.1 OsmC family protein [Gammaproteobacteria bacterium]